MALMVGRGPATALPIIATDMSIMVITFMAMIGMMIGADEQQRAVVMIAPVMIMIGTGGTSSSTSGSAKAADALVDQQQLSAGAHLRHDQDERK